MSDQVPNGNQPGQFNQGSPGQGQHFPPPGQQGMPSPQQASQMPAMQPKQKKKWPWILLGVFLLLILLVAGCGAWLWSIGSGPINATNDYYDAIVAEDYDEAHSLLCSSTAAEITPEQIESVFSTDKLNDFSVSGFELTNGITRVKVTLGAASGTRQLDIPVVEEDDGWKVCPS